MSIVSDNKICCQGYPPGSLTSHHEDHIITSPKAPQNYGKCRQEGLYVAEKYRRLVGEKLRQQREWSINQRKMAIDSTLEIKIFEITGKDMDGHDQNTVDLILITALTKASIPPNLSISLFENPPEIFPNHCLRSANILYYVPKIADSFIPKIYKQAFLLEIIIFPKEYETMMPYHYFPHSMNVYYPFFSNPFHQAYPPCPPMYFHAPEFSHPHLADFVPQISDQEYKTIETITMEPKDNALQVSGLCDSSQTAADQKPIQWNKDELKVKNQNHIAVRNANSNLLRIFFRQLEQQLDQDQSMITRIIKKKKMKTTCGRFLEWLQINRVEHKNYVRLPCVKKMFIARSGKEEHPKIMRILLQNFLQKDAMCSYLTSKKIKKTMMHYNYHSMRAIFKELRTAVSA